MATFRVNERVEAAEDLSSVPAGTPGTVIQVSGLDWIRYRVQFDNGVERNLIDAKRLRPVDKAKAKAKARR